MPVCSPFLLCSHILICVLLTPSFCLNIVFIKSKYYFLYFIACLFRHPLSNMIMIMINDNNVCFLVPIVVNVLKSEFVISHMYLFYSDLSHLQCKPMQTVRLLSADVQHNPVKMNERNNVVSRNPLNPTEQYGVLSEE